MGLYFPPRVWESLSFLDTCNKKSIIQIQMVNMKWKLTLFTFWMHAHLWSCLSDSLAQCFFDLCCMRMFLFCYSRTCCECVDWVDYSLLMNCRSLIRCSEISPQHGFLLALQWSILKNCSQNEGLFLFTSLIALTKHAKGNRYIPTFWGTV